ncbi:MAG TPA: LysM peptidoglycan-binding domain-containing protein [Gemmatimonadaceae bacterium]|nr:LysM peptidoglycan-binding domain-containing protein [Gemmatimonadaceae bacterium]
MPRPISDPISAGLSMHSRREHHSHATTACVTRFPIATIAAVALMALFGSTPLLAQDSASTGRSHVVRKHDTLWDLSQQYLGDPFLWPSIYHINTDVVEDPHWIYPGERLRIPGGTTVATAPADSAVATPQDIAAPAPAEEVAATPEPPVSTGPTVFFNAQREYASPRAETPVANEPPARGGMAPPPAVRAAEVYPAPWVDHEGGPAMAGKLIARAEPLGIAATEPMRKLGVQERVYIRLPRNVVPAAGDRYLTYRLGPEVPEGQIIVPTGIVVVERADNGDATTVRIVRMFDEVELGNGVIPLVSPTNVPTGVTREPLELGTMARVVWIPSEPVLPTVQRYVVLDVTAPEAVKLGDQFTLLRPRQHLDDGTWLPEEPVALAQVVRINHRSVTAIIVDQRHPTIHPGMVARLTARVP